MQCVVFDMDGVLFDSEALVLQCWEQTAKLHGIPEIQEICHRCLGSNADMARQMFLEKYGADFPYDTYKAEMSAKYWENVEADRLELKSGVREMLTALRAHGWKTGIASSTRAVIVRKEMQHFGLEQMFDQIIGGDMVQHASRIRRFTRLPVGNWAYCRQRLMRWRIPTTGFAPPQQPACRQS